MRRVWVWVWVLQVMTTLRTSKQFLSICVCVQLLKVAKFTSALVPKMGLAPLVLKKALPDLIFFGFVFLMCAHC